MTWSMAYQQDISTQSSGIPRRLGPSVFERLPRTRPLFDYYAASSNGGLGELMLSRDGRLTREVHARLLEVSRRGELWVAGCDIQAYLAFSVEHPEIIVLDETLPEEDGSVMILAALEAGVNGVFSRPNTQGIAGLLTALDATLGYLCARQQRIVPLYAAMRPGQGLPAHSVRSLVLGLCIMEGLGEGFPAVSYKNVYGLALGLLLHDIGMSRIPRFVTDKAMGLHLLERGKVRQHTSLGLAMLGEAGITNVEALRCVAEHHERLDGSGYPNRLKGNAISRSGRITAVADSLAAMMSDRSYAPALTLEEALRSLAKERHLYDESLVRALLSFLLVMC